VPQLSLLAGDAVDEQVVGLPGEQRRNHLGGQIGPVVGAVVGRVHDQRQRRVQEVHQLGRVRIVDVRLQFSLCEWEVSDALVHLVGEDLPAG
jgi:hypothetical protein